MTRLVIITTIPLTVHRLMAGQLAFLKSRGFDITVIASPGELLGEVAQQEGIRVVGVPMERELSVVRDLISLGRLTLAILRLKPEIVSAGTPKGGLLGTIAARLTGVPVVIYHLRGIRFETTTGMKRRVLRAAERVAAACADSIQCNGESLRNRFTELVGVPREKTWVPAHGTSNGIAMERFARTPEAEAWATSERERLGFAANDVVVGFVGRFARDKGICDLVDAFERAAYTRPNLRLLLVGDKEVTDPLPTTTTDFLASDSRVRTTGFVRDPSKYYAMIDVFAFPSYREGFPNAPLEAASAGVPVVGFRATGTVDAVSEGETGLLVPIGDVHGLASAIGIYSDDPALRRLHGEAGRRRTETLFARRVVWTAIGDTYARLAAAARADATEVSSS